MCKVDEELNIQNDIYEYSKELLSKKSNGFYNKYIKRLLGLFIALILFIILLPVLIII